ncbi:MAG: ROK family transcriptional regulator [Chitinophagaceae bacterium]
MIPKSKKKINSVLRELYKSGPLPINELANRCGKSVSLTTSTVFECMEEGLVEESGLASSNGGRKATLYQLRAESAYTVVLAMDQYVSRVMVMDMSNQLVSPPVLVDIDLTREEGIAVRVLELLGSAIEGAGVPRERILGVGIAMPGFVDAAEGVNFSFIPSPEAGVSLRDYLEGRLGLPVFIDNDSSVVALAESTFGAARGACNAMVVNISWGIGLGIVANGRLYRGENGFAGEFSHIPLFNNDRICSCGKVGCLETETSLKVLLEKASDAVRAGRPTTLRKAFRESDSLEERFLTFIRAVERRDNLAVELLNEGGYNLGRGIAVLVHVFNPKKIVLSGRGALAGSVWLPPIQQAINEHCIRRLSEDIELVVSDIGHQAGLIGTSALVVENMFRS